jgi:adenine-specific DNA-methyltransferase
MAKRTKSLRGSKHVEALVHEEATRRNIPTAELAPVAERMEEIDPVAPVRFGRNTPLKKGATRERDEDLDPQIVWSGVRLRLSSEQARQLQDNGEVEIGDTQLVWRGKDRQDWSDLVVQAPALYIQEKVHPKAIIDDLVRRSKARAGEKDDAPDLFADFNGLDDPEAKLEFYQHDQHWSNRLILGDSLHVMASLGEREHLRGKVQCIYIDPPYGIKFNSNWQVSTLSRDVKDGKREDISREPEQVRAFRDTWKDNIHSYLTYLRDRLTISRELLTDSGSIFVQIGDENVHRVRAVMDEVFGEKRFVSLIAVQKTYGFSDAAVSNVCDYIIWYARNIDGLKVRPVYAEKPYVLGQGNASWLLADDFSYRGVNAKERSGREQVPANSRLYNPDNLVSQGRASAPQPLEWQGVRYDPYQRNSHWKAQYPTGVERLKRANRVHVAENSFRYRRFHGDFSVMPFSNIWTDTGTGNFTEEKIYVVQTGSKTVERCILMTTDPGDLVLDPTCGSGTTATVAEQWGRRWITIDTSRVALALARTRIMGARYPYYYLADTPEGRVKEQDVTGKIQPDRPTHGDIRQGFVYERAPHITLKSIANNAEIDVIWEDSQTRLDPLRQELNAALGKTWDEWEIPREADEKWSANVEGIHKAWWDERIARQKKIDESIAKAADVEFLYDRPYEDKSCVRVAGPFTVESLSPHRVVPADGEELLDTMNAAAGKRRRSKLVTPPTDFASMVLEHLRTAGVHQSEKKDAIRFTSLQGWPGEYIGAEGVFAEGQVQRRAGIFLGPEFGTVSRVDLVAAAREATEARFDVLIACAFNFDAHASELSKLGPLPILKAKMNPDLHMADELKNTGKGNLFVVFGEPDIDIRHETDGNLRVQVKGVDVFDPNTGEIRSNDTDAIAAWFIDTDYDEQNFFVRHAYFLGAQDPYRSLKTALKAEIDEEAWATLYRDTSRPFARPSTGRIAVKVINHFGDEVMKVFAV